MSGTAINDRRLVRDDGTFVYFRAKNYRKKKRGIKRLRGTEFVRRFMLHILPRGMRRMRCSGLMAPNAKRKRQLQLCHDYLAALALVPAPLPPTASLQLTILSPVADPALSQLLGTENYSRKGRVCPSCGSPSMNWVESLGMRYELGYQRRQRARMITVVTTLDFNTVQLAIPPPSTELLCNGNSILVLAL